MPRSTVPDARPTLADVAALAGVSPATASRVLNGTAKVSRSARADVHDAVSRLAYVRQRARAARDQRISSIAAVVCGTDQQWLFADPYFSRILLGAGRELRSDEIQLVLLVVRGATDHPLVERYLARGAADGVMLINAHDRDPLGLTLQAMNVPTVSAGRPTPPCRLPYVDADNRSGAREAVRYLLRSGRKHVVSIAGPPDMAVGADRRDGYREAIAEAGAAGLVLYGDFTQASGEHAMLQLLDHQPDLDAVFVASDLMALGALRALRRAGRKVPDDVAVIGFDDAPLAAHTEPRLTTVRQPVEDMGAAMARHLTRHISGL
ncbi:MAG: LacI family DNA-binding transcriptional regulator, partial [Catenulisporales bacterium]|nr:LacI family DNA-binding transcriptional regulator [Catenulisporales bacterium]